MNATPTETPTYDGTGPQRPTRGAELAHSAVESAASELTRRLAQTPSLLPWVERLALLAEHDVPILLTGETGTGKTSLARLLHDCSPRRNEPFVTVPCGALPPLLIDSEFFGHVRGAFTGAERDR